MTTQDIANQFINDNNGKSLEAEDPNNKYQCLDELFIYCDKLGIDRATIRRLYARQVWENQTDLEKQKFDLFPNTATFIPLVGDIAVFDQRVGYAGHIALVATGSDINNMVSFDQNWDTLHYYHIETQMINGVPTQVHVPYCRIVVHYGYYGVVGFLRPKITVNPDDQLVANLKALFDSGGDATTKIAQDIQQLRAAGKI